MNLQKEFFKLLLIDYTISIEAITKATGIGEQTVLVVLKGMKNRGEIGHNCEPIQFEDLKPEEIVIEKDRGIIITNIDGQLSLF